MTILSRTADVVDRFDVTADPSMPFIAQALEPLIAGRELQPFVGDHFQLMAIEVLRHKPRRRCLVEYQFAGSDSDDELAVLGKARARSTDRATFQVMQALRAAGFDDDAPDGVLVPEPLGVVPAFQMWLQRRVPGSVATGLLATADAVGLAERIAAAAFRLHHSSVPAARQHTPDDELEILRERLTLLADDRPDLALRLYRALDACAELAAYLPVVEQPIHRDFYPDQVLVDGPRLYLLDLDLYASGDPALDVGNFVGHLIEHGLREPELSKYLNTAALSFVERYVSLSPTTSRQSIDVYTTLTLARHIQISSLFPSRRHITENLLALCETRLGIRRTIKGHPSKSALR